MDLGGRGLCAITIQKIKKLFSILSGLLPPRAKPLFFILKYTICILSKVLIQREDKMKKNIKVTTKDFLNSDSDEKKREYIKANFQPLAEHVAEVNGKAKSHTITADDIIEKAVEVEAELERRGVYKKNIVGTEFSFLPRFNLPNSYSHSLITNEVVCRRVGDGWRLVKLEKVETWPNSSGKFEMHVSQAAADDIRNLALANIRIQES